MRIKMRLFTLLILQAYLLLQQVVSFATVNPNIQAAGPLHSILQAVTRPQDASTSSVTSKDPSSSSWPPSTTGQTDSLVRRYLLEIGAFVTYCAVAACALIQWEDVTCSYVLPSRQRTSVSLLNVNADNPRQWGASTVQGLGFGKTERMMLWHTDDDDPLAELPSYNEVMLLHRTVTVPQWKQQESSNANVQAAIHSITESLEQVWKLQAAAEDYQWDILRTNLRAAPFSDLPAAGAVLRRINNNNKNNDQLNEVVGFDWGSCAWRHCGAVADTQEAIDELDQLLGVLEPYEAVFCLDIIERSLRDILAVIPWDRAAEQDVVFYHELPAYVSRISVNGDDEEEATSRIDDAYFKALQELRID